MRLLNYSTQKYLTFSILLLLLSIPIFYIVLNQLFIRSVDESLEQQATLLPEYTKHIDSEEDLVLWKDLDWDVVVLPDTSGLVKNKPYTVEQYSKINEEYEQFRVLEKRVILLNKKYIIAFKSSLIEKEDLIQAVLGLLITLLIILTAGAIYINYYINKKIWAPFSAILDYLKAYDLDKSEKEWTEDVKITEFNELKVSVNHLIRRVRKTYLAQREFTENAAHELQTPLAVIKSKLDLFLQEQNLSEHQSVLIEDMNQAISGLEKLNLNLLLLAKIDNGQYQLNEKIEIAKVVEYSFASLSFLAEPYDIILKFEKENDFELNGNLQLYSLMVKNLLVNAIKYSDKASIISVTLTKDRLIFRNPGNPLPFDSSKLFKRFSKLDSSQKGNGLGLSISQKVAELHCQRIYYSYKENFHVFTIELGTVN